MEDWTERMRKLVQDREAYHNGGEEARRILYACLRQAKRVKMRRRCCSVAVESRLLAGFLYHLFLVDHFLKEKDYRLACCELEQVLRFTRPENMGLLANIVSVLEAEFNEVGQKE